MASTRENNFNEGRKRETKLSTTDDNFDYEGVKNVFNQKLEEYLSDPRMQSKRWTSYNIQAAIKIIKEGKTLQAEGKPLSVNQYLLMQKYDVVKENGMDVLYADIKNKKYQLFRRILAKEDYFDYILKAHRKVGHLGAYLTYGELRYKYVIVPVAIKLFIKYCNVCKGKYLYNDRRKLIPTTLPCRPITNPITSPCRNKTDYHEPIDNLNPSILKKNRQPSKFNRCAFMGFVDMRWKPDGSFNYLMYYIDNETTYTLLRALTGIENEDEILMELLNIFFDYGPPQELYTSTKQTSEQIERYLKKYWSAFNINIVCLPGFFKGTSRHFLDMIYNWMSQNNCENWGLGCRILQYQTNYCVKNDVSAYEMVFNFTTPQRHDGDKSSTFEQNQSKSDIKEEDSEDISNSEVT